MVEVRIIGLDKLEKLLPGMAKPKNPKELIEFLEAIAGELPAELKSQLQAKCESCPEPCEAMGGEKTLGKFIVTRSETHEMTPEQLAGVRIFLEYLDENNATVVGIDEFSEGKHDLDRRIIKIAKAANYEPKLGPEIKRLCASITAYTRFTRTLKEIDEHFTKEKSEDGNGRT